MSGHSAAECAMHPLTIACVLAAELRASDPPAAPAPADWPFWGGRRDYDGVPLASSPAERALLEATETPDERRRRLSREWELLIG